MRYNAHFKIYYERKLKEGKNKFTIFNAMKNKLVRLIFSLAKQGKKYDENYTYSLVWIIEIPSGGRCASMEPRNDVPHRPLDLCDVKIPR